MQNPALYVMKFENLILEIYFMTNLVSQSSPTVQSPANWGTHFLGKEIHNLDLRRNVFDFFIATFLPLTSLIVLNMVKARTE